MERAASFLTPFSELSGPEVRNKYLPLRATATRNRHGSSLQKFSATIHSWAPTGGSTGSMILWSWSWAKTQYGLRSIGQAVPDFAWAGIVGLPDPRKHRRKGGTKPFGQWPMARKSIPSET